jgi:nitroreductase
MENKVLDIIKSRRTTRSYKDDQLTNEEIMILLEAAAFAPSGHNTQPWHFTIVQNQELLKEMSDMTKNFLKNMKIESFRKIGENPLFHVFYNAPTVIVVSYDNNALSPIQDISAATENILLQAEHMGLGACWNGLVTMLFKSSMKDSFIEKLEIPEGHTPHHAIALGYPKTKVINAPERKENYFNFVK